MTDAQRAEWWEQQTAAMRLQSGKWSINELLHWMATGEKPEEEVWEEI